jgi:hypothetical protein
MKCMPGDLPDKLRVPAPLNGAIREAKQAHGVACIGGENMIRKRDYGRQRRLWLLTVSVSALILTVAGIASAAEFGSGEQYQLPAGQIVEDDLYVSAGTVIIDGIVQGDLIAFGGYIEVNGEVTGDLIAAGGGIVVNGRVGDDVRVGMKICATEQVAMCLAAPLHSAVTPACCAAFHNVDIDAKGSYRVHIPAYQKNDPPLIRGPERTSRPSLFLSHHPVGCPLDSASAASIAERTQVCVNGAACV